MMSRAAATTTLLGMLCVDFAACASSGVLPVALMGSAPGSRDVLAIDRVHYHVKLADAWVFVEVENLTADTLRLDVDGLLFTGPDGTRHRLVPGDALARNEGSSRRSGPSIEPSALRLRAPPPLALRHHPASLTLRRLQPASRSVRIAPGESHADYFYPAEHVALAPWGEWSVAPLFCWLRADETPAGERFEVAVPLGDGRAVHTVLLDGIVTGDADAHDHPR